MRALVVGGTGTAGRPTVAELLRRGHDVAVLSRSGRATGGAEGLRADLGTGAGLAEAMRGVDVVIDTSNITTLNGKLATAFFTGATRRLVAAEADAEVRRHVLLSIVGLELVPNGYYRAKLAQERALAEAADEAGLAWCIQRATQFHEFAAQMIDRMRRGRIVPVPSMAVQPVSALDVALALADAAETGAPGRLPDLAGPQAVQFTDMVRAVLTARGEGGLVVPLRVPGRAGRALRSGALRPASGTPVRLGQVRFAEYLATLRTPAPVG